MVTSGASRVPYLSGAFAGSGDFKVSPILGYQSGANLDGTPNTTSRQFQAGLSVTGKGTAQNATLFVMTSQISNAPNAGFTQAGGFTGVTVRNPAGWFGLASGSVSSATAATSSPNTVSTVNGTPIAGFTLNNANTNLNTGAVTNSLSSNFVKPGGTTKYTFDPVTAGTPTYSASNHPNLALSGYVGGVMLTANGGTPGAPANFTKPYVVTNLTGTPGDVGIFLPGDSSEMLAVFNVKSVAAPTGGMTNSQLCLRKPGRGQSRRAERSARRLCQSVEFRSAGGRDLDNGANIPLSARDWRVAVGARRLRQSADGDSRKRRREHSRIPDLDFLHHSYALRVPIHSVGFLERLQRRNQQQRSTRVRGSGRSHALGRRRPDDEPGGPSW